MSIEHNIEEISYQIGDLSLRGLACGNVKHDVVLCLHGWLDNAASFIPVMPYIANRRIIAIDWAGHGFSSHRSQDAHYHFIDWVYDLLQLFELNDWHNIDVIGHSMGGMIASAFSAAFPERIKSLTLIDSIGFIYANADETTTQLRKGMLSRLKNSAVLMNKSNLQSDLINKRKNAHPSLTSAINARVQVSDMKYDQAQIIVTRGLVKENEGFVWRADSRLRTISPYRLTLPQSEKLIEDIKCPVQLIYGSKGLDMVTSGISHFGPLFMTFTSHQLLGGHHVHMEDPEQTAKLINDFI